MKRRIDNAAALQHNTKRNRADSSLEEESELSSQGSLDLILKIFGEIDSDFCG